MPNNNSENEVERHPLAIAWDEWMLSEEGMKATNPSTLGPPERSSIYLINRLHQGI